MYNSAYETLRKRCDSMGTFSVENILSIDEIKDIAVSPWSRRFASREDHPMSARAHKAWKSALLIASSSFAQRWQWHVNPYLDNNISRRIPNGVAGERYDQVISVPFGMFALA
jgi:hypothetical protein